MTRLPYNTRLTHNTAVFMSAVRILVYRNSVFAATAPA